MPDWDANSAELTANLIAAALDVRDRAVRRELPTVLLAKQWHKLTLRALRVPKAEVVGRFRGEPGLQACGVEIGGRRGVSPLRVAAELSAFERGFKTRVTRLDAEIDVGALPSARQIADIIALCAWVHAE
jgi:hypothetical protein